MKLTKISLTVFQLNELDENQIYRYNPEKVLCYNVVDALTKYFKNNHRIWGQYKSFTMVKLSNYIYRVTDLTSKLDLYFRIKKNNE